LRREAPAFAALLLFTNGAPTGEISRFIAYVQSHSELVRKDGFILIRDMKVKESDRGGQAAHIKGP
jgi:hypothetical protein